MIVTTSQWCFSRNQERLVSTDEPTLVLMAGLPGAGKTKLAYALKEELGWRVVDKDQHIMELKKQEKDLDDKRASWEAYDQSFEEVSNELLEHHSSVILDSAALRQFILDKANDIVNDVPNTQLKIILCVADRALRDERLRTRSSPHPRSMIDVTLDVDQAQVFKHLLSEPKRLVLDMSQPFEEIVAKAKAYLLS